MIPDVFKHRVMLSVAELEAMQAALQLSIEQFPLTEIQRGLYRALERRVAAALMRELRPRYGVTLVDAWARVHRGWMVRHV